MKTKARYLIYAGLTLLFYIMGIYMGTGKLDGVYFFIDPFALGMVVFSLLLVAGAGAGLRGMSDAFFDAFSGTVSSEKIGRYSRSLKFFKMMDRSCLFISALMILGSTIVVLANYGDKSAVGKGVGFGLLGLVYSLLLRAFLFQPLRLLVRRKMIEAGEVQND